MKIHKWAALVILLTGLAHIVYGALTIYLSSMNVADLPIRISNTIYATGETWEFWKKAFFRGGIYVGGVGIAAVVAGIGIIRTKSWGRTIWLFLSPILLLSQFSQGQKSLTQFNKQGNYKLAFVLLIVVTLSWIMLLLPSSRTELGKKDPTSA